LQKRTSAVKGISLGEKIKTNFIVLSVAWRYVRTKFVSKIAAGYDGCQSERERARERERERETEREEWTRSFCDINVFMRLSYK
jgi:hypothetical protein